MGDRWEGKVHFYDHTPDSIKRWPNRDAFTVAEAWMYSEDEPCCLGIVVLLSGKDLMTKAVTVDQAIKDGSTLRNRLVQEHRDEARSLKVNRTLLYSWNGHQVE